VGKISSSADEWNITRGRFSPQSGTEFVPKIIVSSGTLAIFIEIFQEIFYRNFSREICVAPGKGVSFSQRATEKLGSLERS